MAQKTLFKNKKVQKKVLAANRHGKIPITKKGKLQRPPKQESLKRKAAEEEALTQAINARNEAKIAGIASQKGGPLKVAPGVTAAASGKSAAKTK